MNIRTHELPVGQTFDSLDDIHPDTLSVLDLYASIGSYSDAKLIHPRQAQCMLEELENGICYVASDENKSNKIIGMANYQPDEFINEAWILSIAVDRSYQHQGIGSEMMKFLEQETVRRNIGRMCLLALSSAADFYIQKHGFQITDKQDIDDLPLLYKQMPSAI